jgi:outer membrane protein TolC
MKLPAIISLKFGRAALLGLFLAATPFSAAPAEVASSGNMISLREVLDNALLQNRQLQIERINPEIMRMTLRAARGFYDPLFQTRVHTESAVDTGGFDPANFSADAIFDADSEVVSSGLTGFLPSGLTYTLGGSYAHSSGTRNFLDFDSYKVGLGVTVEQPLLRNLWIDQPRWQIQINKQNLKISELGVYFVAMSVINFAQQGYYDLIYAWDSLRVQQDLLATRDQFLKGIQRQVELGMMTALEEKLARSQQAQSQTDLITASNAVALASNNLRTLMGLEEKDWSDALLVPAEVLVTVPGNFDRHSSWRTGLTQRPDLLQLAENLKSADLTVKYRKNQLYPMLNLFGSYSLKGSDALQAFPGESPKASRSIAFEEIRERDAPNSLVGVLFSVPLTSTAERANYRMSREQKKQAELLLKQKEELVLREISDAMDLAKFSFSRAESARNAVSFAAEALQAEEQRLQGGTGSIFLVLQAQTELARARVTELLARRDYNRALSQLYFAEGTLLEHVQFDVRFNQ